MTTGLRSNANINIFKHCKKFYRKMVSCILANMILTNFLKGPGIIPDPQTLKNFDYPFYILCIKSHNYSKICNITSTSYFLHSNNTWFHSNSDAIWKSYSLYSDFKAGRNPSNNIWPASTLRNRNLGNSSRDVELINWPIPIFLSHLEVSYFQ